MNRLCNFLTGASLGAGLVYFFDPVVGNRRRALLRDQIVHLMNKSCDVADARYRDLQNRAYGTVAEFRSKVTEAGNEISDRVLVDRVRGQIGRHVSNPRAIEVTAHEGVVTLSGPVLADEVDELISGARAVRGVCDVEDQLDVYESSRDIPSLQRIAAAKEARA